METGSGDSLTRKICLNIYYVRTQSAFIDFDSSCAKIVLSFYLLLFILSFTVNLLSIRFTYDTWLMSMPNRQPHPHIKSYFDMKRNKTIAKIIIHIDDHVDLVRKMCKDLCMFDVKNCLISERIFWKKYKKATCGRQSTDTYMRTQ